MLGQILVIASLMVSILSQQRESGHGDITCNEPLCYCIKKSNKAFCSDFSLDYIPRFPKFVTSVTITNTSLRFIEEDGLFNLTFNRIERLNFTGNQLEYIHHNAFKNLSFINRLVVSRELLLNVSIIKHSLTSLTSNIKHLYFSNNRWESFPKDIFSTFHDRPISLLDMSGNRLQFIDLSSLTPLKRLRTLYLSDNKIQDFAMKSMPELNFLDISNNQVYDLPSFCNSSKHSYFPKLETLSVSKNNIGHLSVTTLSCLPRVERLNMDSLNVDAIENNVFVNLGSLNTLSISRIGNPLHRIKPFAFNSSSLKRLIFTENKFHFNKDRFNPKTIFSVSADLTHLDLMGNYLPTKARILREMLRPLKNLQYLNLASTGITNLPRHIFIHMTSLQKLFLDSNNINAWNDSESIFGNTSNLVYLSLKQNYISIVNKSSFPASLLTSLKKLNIARNPFSCTCDQMWFRNWIEDTNLTLVQYPSQYKCRFPANNNGMLLQNYRPSTKICPPWNPLYTMAIVLGCVLVLTFILSFLAIQCQDTIKNYIYLLRVYRQKHRGYLPVDGDTDYEFHAFVVYCDKDRAWVHGELLQKLEGEEGLTLCIHHRNFIVGDAITSNIDKFLKRSWKVIIVVSNNFAKSDWCQWEVDVALERRRKDGRDAILPIIFQKVDSKHMTSQLKTLLDSTPNVRYRSGIGSELFWKAVIESLRKPLGHPPVSIM